MRRRLSSPKCAATAKRCASHFRSRSPTPAAVFRRADTIWLVFDSAVPIDIGKIAAATGSSIRGATVTRSRAGQVVQLKLDRPKLTSAGAEGNDWTVIVGDMMLEPTQPLGSARHTQVRRPRERHHPIRPAAPASSPRRRRSRRHAAGRHRARAGARISQGAGIRRVQRAGLVHGVVIQPLADDLTAEIAPDKVVVTRPGGLVLSNAGARASAAAPGTEGTRRATGGLSTLDPQAWGFDREADFRDRQMHLIAAAAAAEDARRMPAQLELARFYLARDLTAEAKGVLDSATLDERAAQDGTAAVLRAVANIMLGRGADALKDLSSGAVSRRNDIALWRALAQVREGKWVEAREGFRTLDTAAAALPLEMQKSAEAIVAASHRREGPNTRSHPLHRIRCTRQTQTRRLRCLHGLRRLAAVRRERRAPGVKRARHAGNRAETRL